MTRANLVYYHADRYPHPADTRLAPHYSGIMSYSVKVFSIHTIKYNIKLEKEKEGGQRDLQQKQLFLPGNYRFFRCD
jgi:hypothetical protein